MANNSELDQAFKELEEDFGYAKEARREVIRNLRSQAASVKVSEYDKSTTIIAKMTIIKTFDDLLKSDSDLTLQKLKMKLARKDSEMNGAVGQTIVAMLKNMRVNESLDNNVADPTVDAQKELSARMEKLSREGDEKTKKALSISEGEIQETGGLPTTETPVAKLKPLKQTSTEEE